jgi:hypothetical protein
MYYVFIFISSKVDKSEDQDSDAVIMPHLRTSPHEITDKTPCLVTRLIEQVVACRRKAKLEIM